MPMVKVAHVAWHCVWWNAFWRRRGGKTGGDVCLGEMEVVETTNGLVKLVSWVGEVG